MNPSHFSFARVLHRLLSQRVAQRILRYAYRYTHSRAMRHNQALWPLVRICRDNLDRITDCKIRGTIYSPPLTDLDDVPRQDGRTCHLILSGPSISSIDYDQLDLECVMGVNGSIALLERYPNLKFDYYAILDTGFMSRRRALVERIIAQDMLLLATPEVLKWLALYIPAERLRCQVAVFEEVDVRAMRPRLAPAEAVAQLKDDSELILFDTDNAEYVHGFSLNVRRGLFGGGTVAYSALQFLNWLGFRTLYVHGLDMKNAGSQPRFYETAHDKLGTSLDKEFSNHIEPAFRAASALLRERGVRIYNLSLDSALGDDIFPRVDWQILLRQSGARA